MKNGKASKILLLQLSNWRICSLQGKFTCKASFVLQDLGCRTCLDGYAMKDNKMKAIATLKICLGKEFCISCAPSALARKQSLAGDVFIRVVHHCEKQSKAMSQPAWKQDVWNWLFCMQSGRNCKRPWELHGAALMAGRASSARGAHGGFPASSPGHISRITHVYLLKSL